MHAAWVPHKYVQEPALMVTHCLEDNRWKQLPMEGQKVSILHKKDQECYITTV